MPMNEKRMYAYWKIKNFDELDFGEDEEKKKIENIICLESFNEEWCLK